MVLMHHTYTMNSSCCVCVTVLERTWHVHGKDVVNVKGMVTSDIQPIINSKTFHVFFCREIFCSGDRLGIAAGWTSRHQCWEGYCESFKSIIYKEISKRDVILSMSSFTGNESWASLISVFKEVQRFGWQRWRCSCNSPFSKTVLRIAWHSSLKNSTALYQWSTS